MRKYLKVENEIDLVRDSSSGAIINRNVSEFEAYKKRKLKMQENQDKVRDACREINNLKQELYEIKDLIKKLVVKMADRSVATTDTVETFRTTFNSLATDLGDISNLNVTGATDLVEAVNTAATASVQVLSLVMIHLQSNNIN